MALDDESLSEEIAGLPWVVDGINPEEAGVLDDVSWLLKTDTAVLETILNFRWMSEDGVISADTRRALRAIRAATDADPRLGSTLAAYGWIPDEVTQHEAEALEILAEAVFPAFRTQTVTGIGAIRVPRSGVNAPPSVTAKPFEFARLLAEYPWVRDGIDPPEPDNLRQLSQTVSRATPANADLIRELTNVVWIQDGITDLEAQAVVSWDNFFSNTDESHLILAETVWGFDWAQDDTNTEEISLVDHLTNLGSSDGANQVRALETVLSYDWLRDDVTSVELAFMEEPGTTDWDSSPPQRRHTPAPPSCPRPFRHSRERRNLELGLQPTSVTPSPFVPRPKSCQQAERGRRLSGQRTVRTNALSTRSAPRNSRTCRSIDLTVERLRTGALYSHNATILHCSFTDQHPSRGRYSRTDQDA